jgi:hypothetical protein
VYKLQKDFLRHIRSIICFAKSLKFLSCFNGIVVFIYLFLQTISNNVCALLYNNMADNLSTSGSEDENTDEDVENV